MDAKNVNKGTHPDFFTTFLSNPATSIPKGAQWAVFFSDLSTKILPAISLAYEREPMSDQWNTEEAAKTVLNKTFQESKGCMFCQAIGLVGESMNTNMEGEIKYNAFLRSFVGGGRTDFPTMRMTFLDTNISFCDTFLRGWALATANFGLIARSGDQNYRTDMTCLKFGITPNGPVILQKYKFNGICCISVSQEEYDYRPVTSPIEREAQFIFHSYALEAYNISEE